MQIEISDTLGAWLQEISARAGVSPDQLVQYALERELEDREDLEAAIGAKQEIDESGGRTYSLEEVSRTLELED